MATHVNHALELARAYVHHTDKNIFLTGKAGTGKTTFLRRIKEEATKRLTVVAPTGIAAINAQGVTIHSLFQLPFGPLVPGAPKSHFRNLSKKNQRILRALDLLIIDEISMVRADVLDGIDQVLRRYRFSDLPFGGVQLLMIGDLHQLPPVVKNEEAELLKQHYDTSYFFGSKALRQTRPVKIQLTHIYRQSDAKFIDLLNRVRDGSMSPETIGELNANFRPDFEPAEEEGYITLTSHNRTARAINRERLEQQPGDSKTFTADIRGKFPESMYPTHAELEFKKGAQVLFIKNDPTGQRIYYNGKIGTIVDMSDDSVTVRCPGDEENIRVTAVEWKNVKYSLNEQTREIDEDKEGTFEQLPLKLAWAITIHKSQGLTFDKVVIDAQAAFAHGQVYVALSRCRTWEGVVLRTPIRHHSVRTDGVVRDYSQRTEREQPNEEHLEQSKREFQEHQLLRFFDYKTLRTTLGQLERQFLENESSLTEAATERFRKFASDVETELFSLAEKFKFALRTYFDNEQLPSENIDLAARLVKASDYLAPRLESFRIALQKIPIISDDQEIQKRTRELVGELSRQLYQRRAALLSFAKGYDPQRALRAVADASLDKLTKPDFGKLPTKGGSTGQPEAITPSGLGENSVLFDRIREWRVAKAREMGVAPFAILHNKVAMEIARCLPKSISELRQVKGIGPMKLIAYGEELLNLVQEYLVDELREPEAEYGVGELAQEE